MTHVPLAKMRVYKQVQRAVDGGQIEKGPCSRCGSAKHLHAHHADYARPLEVTWFCKRCHYQDHMAKHEGDRSLPAHGRPRKREGFRYESSQYPPIRMAEAAVLLRKSRSYPEGLAYRGVLALHEDCRHGLKGVTRESLSEALKLGTE